MFDLVVIGGGAAGFFGAVTAAAGGARVVILEATSRFLSKVEVSGGGRCNVTHDCDEPLELVKNYPRGAKELLGPFNRFNVQDTRRWFEEREVKLKTESDGRIFPLTDSSQTIINALKNEVKKFQVELQLRSRVQELSKQDESWQIRTKSEAVLQSKFVLLATGGSEHGHDLAKSCGHTITPLAPSLFTFEIEDQLLAGLSGISFPHSKLTIGSLTCSGPTLITHWGLSGPATLRLSALAARELFAADYKAALKISWLQPHDMAEGVRTLNSYREAHPKRTLFGNTPFEMPKRFWERICECAQVSPDLTYASLSNEVRDRISAILFDGQLAVTGKGEFKEEFVTCGGVELSEVNMKSFESRIAPGLFFAGEVLDIDGITGGFNFQNAWTGGWHVGSEIARRIASTHHP